MKRIIFLFLVLTGSFLFARQDTFVDVVTNGSIEIDTVYFKHDNLDVGIPTTNQITKIIDREGYACGYSATHKQSLWVQYCLTANEVNVRVTERSDKFVSDPLVKDSPTPDDYKRSGYDRGHLAPAADMLWSVGVMEDSFYMSNMSPQLPDCNRETWKDLESWVRSNVKTNGSVFVISGPIFSTNETLKVIGTGVTVPMAYFKVLYKPNSTIGFIVPNATYTNSFQSCACSVLDVERITNMNFFNRVKNIQKLKDSVDLSNWYWE